LKTPQIPADVWTEIEGLKADVIAGKIKVEPVFEATDVRAMMSDVKE
jgi:simple sugar transport system substrate-binding protein